MKKLLALAVLSVSVCAFAEDVACANVLGILRVDSNLAQTIVSIPWLDASVSGGDVKVCDIVKTANLTAGDELRYYNPSTKKYQCWQLNSANPPAWEPVTTVGDAGTESASADTTLARGNALMLIRKNPNAAFYLCGQVGATASVNGTFAHGAWSLIAPPTAAATQLNNATWTDVHAEDQILFRNASGKLVTLLRKDNAWKGRVTTISGGVPVETWTTDAAIVPAGCGAWYKSSTNSVTDVSVTWPSVPSVQ